MLAGTNDKKRAVDLKGSRRPKQGKVMCSTCRRMGTKHEPQVESFRANDGGVLRDPMRTRLPDHPPRRSLAMQGVNQMQSQGEMNVVTDLPQDQ